MGSWLLNAFMALIKVDMKVPNLSLLRMFKSDLLGFAWLSSVYSVIQSSLSSLKHELQTQLKSGLPSLDLNNFTSQHEDLQYQEIFYWLTKIYHSPVVKAILP